MCIARSQATKRRGEGGPVRSELARGDLLADHLDRVRDVRANLEVELGASGAGLVGGDARDCERASELSVVCMLRVSATEEGGHERREGKGSGLTAVGEGEGEEELALWVVRDDVRHARAHVHLKVDLRTTTNSPSAT